MPAPFACGRGDSRSPSPSGLGRCPFPSNGELSARLVALPCGHRDHERAAFAWGEVSRRARALNATPFAEYSAPGR